MIFFSNFINSLIVTKVNMKRFFIIILITIISIASVFAETTINFSSDKKSYDIEDIIQLNVTINTDTPWDNQIYIQWAETFQIISKRESHSSVNINGEKKSSVTLSLWLLAPDKWDYTLWPVTVSNWDEVNLSNSIDVEIKGERIMVNNKFDTIQKNLWNDKSEQKDNPDEDVDIDSVDLWETNTTEEIVPKIIIWVDGEEMTDIYRDKWFLYSYALLKKLLSILALIVISIIAIVLWRKYLQKYLQFKEENREEEIVEIIKEEIEIDYPSLLNNLKNNYLDSSKEIFYAQTWEVYRIYLDDKIQQWLSKWSLKEVQSFLKKVSIDKEVKTKLINFYKKIYFPEYNTWEDNIEERHNVLEELEKFIIVKNFK